MYKTSMLKGKELGVAIKEAIALKKDSGAIKSIAEVARHFGIKPPSLQGWLKRGTVGKEKLPKLWDYFADVVGPEHWGLDPKSFFFENSERTDHKGNVKVYSTDDPQKQALIELVLAMNNKNLKDFKNPELDRQIPELSDKKPVPKKENNGGV